MASRILLAFFVVFLADSQLVAHERAPLAPTRPLLTAENFNSQFEIKGPLGEPLSKLIEITAHVVESPDKGKPELLVVTSVSGSRLSPPVVMPYHIAAPWAIQKPLCKDNDYTLRVYQTGHFVGIPDSAMRETARLHAEGNHFRTSLVVVKSFGSQNAALRIANVPLIIIQDEDEATLLGESP